MRRAIVSSSRACSESFESPIGTEDYWQAWFDGAALPNPGKIGIGVVLISPESVRSDRSVLMGCSGCNNEAELHALCAALEMACTAGVRRLVLRGDSDVAIRYVREPDRTQIGRLLILVAQARDWLPHFDDVQLVWIPRHRNAEADRLSRQVLGLSKKPVRVAKRRRRAR